MNLGVFSGKIWAKEFIKKYKQYEGVFSLFRVEPVPVGNSTVRVPLFGAGTAKQLTPGTAPEMAGGTTNYRDIAVDQFWTYDEPVTNIGEMQSSVSARSAFSEMATDTLLGKIDELLITKLAGYVSAESIPDTQVFASYAPVDNTAAAIAAELNDLLTKAVTQLQTDYGRGGSKKRFALLDANLYNNLVMGSSKQSPERTDIPFGQITGEANPILGTKLYSPGVTHRTTVAEYGGVAAHTLYKCWVLLPSAVALGVQQLPMIEAEYSASGRATRLCTTEYFGLATGDTGQFVELRVKVKS